MFRSKRTSARLTHKLQAPLTRYVPESRLAVGGMAEVWRGQAYVENGETFPVAIKRILPELEQKSIFSSMFMDEARLGMLLRHPNIVRVYDARVVQGTYLMIMELVDGVSLKGLLGPAQSRNAGMPVHAAVYVGQQVARALDYAHGARTKDGTPLGIIHRDVSPHNVLLGVDGAVKLVDFGLANAVVHRTQLMPGVGGGKLGYVAPEIFTEEHPPHPGVDVFAAGVMLWEALAGRRLFVGQDDAETVRNVVRGEIPRLCQINPAIPPPIDTLISEALERDPTRRLNSARELEEGLAYALDYYFPGVNQRDIALLTGVHMSAHRPQSDLPPPTVVQRVATELEAFAVYAAGSEVEGPDPRPNGKSGTLPRQHGADYS